MGLLNCFVPKDDPAKCLSVDMRLSKTRVPEQNQRFSVLPVSCAATKISWHPSSTRSRLLLIVAVSGVVDCYRCVANVDHPQPYAK